MVGSSRAPNRTSARLSPNRLFFSTHPFFSIPSSHCLQHPLQLCRFHTMYWVKSRFRRSKPREAPDTSSDSTRSRKDTPSLLPDSSPDLEPDSYPPAFPDGIKVLHEFCDAQADICFVHGLNGDRESTWTAEGQPAPWPGILLPQKLKNVCVLTYGYDAYVVRRGRRH